MSNEGILYFTIQTNTDIIQTHKQKTVWARVPLSRFIPLSITELSNTGVSAWRHHFLSNEGYLVS